MTDQTDRPGEIVALAPLGEGIVRLQMRDEQHRNVFRDALVDGILARLAELDSRFPEAKVLILEGLEEVFAAGADKESLLAIAKGEVHVKDLLISEKIIELPIPTIAAMRGHAVGGGFVMGLCCDIVLMGQSSRYGVNFMEMGFTPGMGCTRLLQGLVGPYIANELMFTATRLKGKQFKERGLVNYVLPNDEVEAKAEQLAAAIAEKPRPALEYLKYSVNLPKRQALEEARVHEDFMHRLTFSVPGMVERIEELYP